MDLARTRLTEERKALNANRPVGTWGKPLKAKDGSVDLLNWHFGIKAAPTSKYALPEGETYRVRVKFPSSFPASPPGVAFDPPIFHTNVFPDGRVCLSLLLEHGHHSDAATAHHGYWQASRSFSDIIRALSIFLDDVRVAAAVRSSEPDRALTTHTPPRAAEPRQRRQQGRVRVIQSEPRGVCEYDIPLASPA